MPSDIPWFIRSYFRAIESNIPEMTSAFLSSSFSAIACKDTNISAFPAFRGPDFLRRTAKTLTRFGELAEKS